MRNSAMTRVVRSMGHDPGESPPASVPRRCGAGDPSPGSRTQRPVGLVGIADPDLRSRVARVLRQAVCAAVTAGNGDFLVERMRDAETSCPGDSRPDLIVADAVLPGCSGLSLLGRLRGLGWEIPIILLTEASNECARWEAWSRGVTGVFEKPFDLDVLCAFVRSVLFDSPSAPAP
jgi:DNA-binding response OmpR family regulator